MKDYRTSMDHLSFSPDQKQAMTARLAAATRQKAAPPKARRTRRILAVAVAAALVLSLGTAGATGADLVIGRFWRVAGTRKALQGHIRREGVFTRREFAEEMLKAPANFYYGVLWNKLYRRSIVEEGGLRCDPEVSWCEDFLFNLEYIRRARLIAATAQPVYCYVKRPGSLVATQATLARTVEMKRTMFAAYKQLYQALDLYDEQKLRVYGYLVSAAKDGGSVALRPPALPKRRARPPRRRTRRRRTGIA